MESKYFKLHKLKDGREVIVHTGHPAFIATVQQLPDGYADIKPVYWFDELDPFKAAALMRRVGDWYFYARQENE